MTELPPLGLQPLPPINLTHLFVLTDDTGILQHATRSTPDLHHGYCTDDNARALIAAVKLWALPSREWTAAGSYGRDDLLVAMQRYLAFLSYAFNADAGRFRNFMQYDRTWLEEVGSEDSHARTVWALGKATRFAPSDDVYDLAKDLALRAMGAIETFEHLRPWAYALLGVDEYLRADPDCGEAADIRRTAAQKLYDVWRANADDDWPWWENRLTWGNAKLPHAMLAAGAALGREDMVDAALKALRWLLKVQTAEDGRLSIIGNDGWYVRDAERATFDQQPIEAKGMVQSCLTAGAVTGEAFWTEAAVRCFEWFTGRNDVGKPLYNPVTGGGHDGLNPHGVNLNQGAESTLAYILSAVALRHYDRAQKGQHELSPAPDFA